MSSVSMGDSVSSDVIWCCGFTGCSICSASVSYVRDSRLRRSLSYSELRYPLYFSMSTGSGIFSRDRLTRGDLFGSDRDYVDIASLSNTSSMLPSGNTFPGITCACGVPTSSANGI